MPRRPLVFVLFAVIELAGAAEAQTIDSIADKGIRAGAAGIGLRGAVEADDRGVIGPGHAGPVRTPASGSAALPGGHAGARADSKGIAIANAIAPAPWGSGARMREHLLGTGGTGSGGSYMTIGAALAALSSRSRDVATTPVRTYTLPVAATLMRPGRGRPGGSATVGEGEWVTGLAMARRLDVTIPAVVPIGASQAGGQYGIRAGAIRAFR